MFKQFLTTTIKNKEAFASFQIELLNKGRKALAIYQDTVKILEEVNSWPHPLWLLKSFQDYTQNKGELLLEKYKGKLKTSFMEVHPELRQFKQLTPEQKFFFLHDVMELGQIKKLKNHTFIVDDDGYPSVEIETPPKLKMSYFKVQDLEKENLRLKDELEILKKMEYFG